jgi:hypothetical protein
MSEYRLRVTVGLLLVVSQFAVILLTVYAYVRNGLKFDEMTTAVALLIPMFAVHTTSVVKHFIATRHAVDVDNIRVTLPFIFLALFFPLLFVFSLLAVIWLKAYSVAFESFNEFKAALGLIQTCFAVYIGLFISSLYEGGSAKDSKSSGRQNISATEK